MHAMGLHIDAPSLALLRAIAGDAVAARAGSR
jgi:hypothetical protein